MSSVASSPERTLPSWTDLHEQLIKATPAGMALHDEEKLRKTGKGAPHVHNTLRLFRDEVESNEDATKLPITLFRDYAGWCPYW